LRAPKRPNLNRVKSNIAHKEGVLKLKKAFFSKCAFFKLKTRYCKKKNRKSLETSNEDCNGIRLSYEPKVSKNMMSLLETGLCIIN